MQRQFVSAKLKTRPSRPGFFVVSRGAISRFRGGQIAYNYQFNNSFVAGI